MASRPLCDRSGRDRRGSIEHLSLHECARKNANRHALHAVRLPAFTRCPMESRPKGYACHKEASIIPRGAAPACAWNVRPMLTCLRHRSHPAAVREIKAGRWLFDDADAAYTRAKIASAEIPEESTDRPMAAANSSAAIQKAMSGPSALLAGKLTNPTVDGPEQHRRKQHHVALKK